MSTQSERMYRVEVMREALSSIGGDAFRLGTPEGTKLSEEAIVLADRLLLPASNSDDASLDEAEKKIKSLRSRCAQLGRIRED